MIDAFYIFTKGGLLLWSTQLVKINGDPLDRLIKEVLLEEQKGESFKTLDPYSLKWKLLNDMDLFFVVVYQGILQITYLEGLLERAAKEFLNHVSSGFGSGLNIKRVDFEADFRKLLQKEDQKLVESKKPRAMKSFAETKKGLQVAKDSGIKVCDAPGKKKPTKGGKDDEEGSDEEAGANSDEANSDAAEPLQAPKKLGGPRPFQKKTKDSAKDKPAVEGADPEKSGSKGKIARQWEGSVGKMDAKSMAKLDFSRPAGEGEEDGLRDEAMAAKRAEFLGDEVDSADEEAASIASDSSDDELQENDKKDGRVGGLFKSFTRGVKNLTGGAVLQEADLAPLLLNLKTQLMVRNVAAEVADKLADSVRVSLVGKKTEKFTSMGSTVKACMTEAMEAILTPKKSIDVLRAALAAKNAGRVYSVVFLGVNGVGKSTNLAKVAYYLKHKGGLNVLICACDTFRAGAVEQLKTHSRCLDVPLFEQGYGKDPAIIAKNAIKQARETGVDVVLVDTAGRMQDNEPLMRALAKLVAMNQPDLVLFVGEALVGNDAIDQVTKFNRSLVDYSHDPKNPRGIDGMLLTKYDTVDEKVGAALSMVYVTGQPIVFVGNGQKYTHLRKLQAKDVVRTLLT